MSNGMRVICLVALGGLSGLFSLPTTVQAQDRVMGQIQFVNSSKLVKTSGVWIDGQYVGYLGELKGMNRLRLLPGDHEISVRQAGYSDFNKSVVIEPRMVVDVRVSMERDPRFIYPDPKTSSEVRLDVQPSRAAVFLDDYYVGTVEEYYGVEHAMLVAPGKHRFKIALPGFKTFETEVELYPRQKFALRTDLMGGSINDADPMIRSDAPRATNSVKDGVPTASR
jgi:hypothetical protein